MAKKTKRPRTGQVTTNFKQNHKRRPPGSRAASGGAPAGRTPGEFDPDQNVRQIEEPMPEAAPTAAPPAAPLATDTMDQDRFASAGRSIPRFPEEG